MVQEKRIAGIMGGTFNPIHAGHIHIAIAAYKQFHLPEILIMPSGNPSSYKDTQMLASASHRCNMIYLAIKNYSYMKLSTLEIDRQGKTFTSDTLEELKPFYDIIYFIIGADSLFELETWHKAAYVMNHCHFLAANRNQYKRQELFNRIEYLKTTYHAKIDLIETKDYPFSSTDIRDRVSKNKSIDKMVGMEVAQYIKDNKLYESLISK